MAEQLYFNSATGQQYAFDPSVTVTPNATGGFTFTAADGEVLPESSITTMVSGTAPVVAPILTLAEQGAALIADGLTITSTGTPALNGVYNIQPGVPFGQEQIAQEAQFITTFSKFTNGTTTALSWPLMNGTLITFTATQQFLNFSEQAAEFVAAVEVAVEANSALPEASATIP
jgi:hypothetical protein